MKNESRPSHGGGAGRDADRALDARLREALEPEPGLVRRLVARALEAEAPPRSRRVAPPRLGWALATAAVALVAILALPRGSESPSSPQGVQDVTMSDITTPDILSSGSAQGLVTPVLTISNAGGVLEITSAAGPKAILFPGDDL